MNEGTAETKQLEDRIKVLEALLNDKEAEIAFLAGTLAQSIEIQEETETENLMLNCENEILFEQNQEYLTGSLYTELWDKKRGDGDAFFKYSA